MDNPFLNKPKYPNGSEYLTSVCSVNRIRLAKLPVYGVDDEIEGRTVKEFFSAKLVIEAVKNNAGGLHIALEGVNEKKLPFLLARKAADDSDKEGSDLARLMIMRFGDRLGLLLLALRLGEPENRAARADWDAAHWEYWAKVEDIILVGGLASGLFGELMRERVNAVFEKRGARPYNILLYDNAAQVGVLGCASCIKQRDGVFVVMDFGQTVIKRSFVVKRGGEITEVHTLDSIPSKNMEWEMPSEEEKLRQAKELNAYLVSAVEKTFCEAKRRTNERPGVEVVISIASYTVDGTLNDSRSGYAKLCALGSNYAELLAWELSGRLRCDIDVRLIHDGTAVALNFRNRKNTVCLSVGSYFGIGFPETRVV